MPKMKWLCCALLLVCAIVNQPSRASATVTTGRAQDVNYTMEYPLVYTSTQSAQDKINQDIYKYIYDFQSSYKQGKFINGNFKYTVKYEDSQYVSILLSDYRWTGGLHGVERGIGLNYNKATGESIPLSFFVKLRPSDSVTIYSPNLQVYDWDNNRIPYGKLQDYSHRTTIPISGNYFMMGNGQIALIYQPYEMAAYAYGITHIVLTTDWIDYFNRKNQ